MASASPLQAVEGGGRLPGFGNLLRRENAAWWRTWTGWIQSVLWLVVLNGLLAVTLRSPIQRAGSAPPSAPAPGSVPTFQEIMGNNVTAGMFLFLIIAGIAVPIAAIVLGQDAIIGEKQSGTAAWVLSKPVSRPAFILAKVCGHALGFLVAFGLVQGAVAYVQISEASGAPPLNFGFAGAMGLLYLNVLFYLTLTLMLGTLFRGRGPVLGITLTLLLGYKLFAGMAPGLAIITPWAMVMDVIPGQLPLTVALALGFPLPTATPVIATLVWCTAFVAVAIWRFRREEL